MLAILLTLRPDAVRRSQQAPNVLSLIHNPNPEQDWRAFIYFRERTIVWRCYGSNRSEIKAHRRSANVGLHVNTRLGVKLRIRRNLHIGSEGLRIPSHRLMDSNTHIGTH